jgi:outer membrane protein assembly factor BamD
MHGCLPLCCSLLLLSACSTSLEDLKDKSAVALHKKGIHLMKSGDYSEAAEHFKGIDTLFPYSSLACEGQVLSAYCRFMASNYTDAIRELEIFLRYHSSNALAPYVMYLRGMCIYMQVASVGRDSRIAQDAKQAFVELINRHPNSSYQKDAEKRIIILDDIIAAHEMLIGRYYQKKNNTLSAIGRYNFVGNHFANTNHAQEAYYRIIECCKAEGLDEEAESTYQILKTKFPVGSWKT